MQIFKVLDSTEEHSQLFLLMGVMEITQVMEVTDNGN